jgi:hypothetical protein
MEQWCTNSKGSKFYSEPSSSTLRSPPIDLPLPLERSGHNSHQHLLEILPSIDRVSRQVIEPSSGHVGQVNGEELDDEEVIVHPTCPAREAMVLQSNAVIGFAIIPDDAIGHPKMLREAHVVHIAPKCFRPWPHRAKNVLFTIIAPFTT